MACYGRIGEFQAEIEDWTDYTDRLDSYFLANDITANAKKTAILVSSVGAKTFKLMKDLVSPTSPQEKGYTGLCDVIKAHFTPKASKIMARYRFYSRNRNSGESVSQYIAELRHLAKDCSFAGQLDEMLRDKLVVGVSDQNIQRKLLSEPDTMTFKEASDIALSMELAAENVQAIQKPQNTIHVVSKKSSKGTTKDDHSILSCHSCGDKHLRSECKFRNAICHYCKKRGHIEKVCQAKQKQGKKTNFKSSKSTHAVTESNVSQDDEDDCYSLYTVKSNSNHSISTVLNIEGTDVSFEIDTGAAATLMSEKAFKHHWPDKILKSASSSLKTYTGQVIPVLGSVDVNVQYQNQEDKLSLMVVKGDGPNLLGRNWLHNIKLNWNEIWQVQETGLSAVLDAHKDVFDKGLGTFKGPEAKIYLDPDAKPQFFKARPVPFSIRANIEKELDRLVREDILQPVQHSEWAAPIVPVMKPDGTIRICGDYKVTVNKFSRLDRYPIPKISDLYASLAGGKTFTKLDLSHAYQQVVLDESSRPCTTINTHKGLFMSFRLPFGVSSSPGIFQRIMDGLLGGIPGVTVYLDDILITGKTQEDHLSNLDSVLKKLSDAGLRLKKEKCSFMVPSVVYLGHRLDSEGLHPVFDKIQAIQDSPEPTDVSKLQSFLGMLNHYRHFLPNISTVLAPLHSLLKKNVTWRWGDSQRTAFHSAKEMLLSSKVLCHYNPEQKLILECDASSYGLGAVLFHKFADGTERPIG